MPRGVDKVLDALISFNVIENLMSMKEPANKARIFWTFLKCQVLSYVEYYLRWRLETEDPELLENELLELVI
jgi:hypothetical protein